MAKEQYEPSITRNDIKISEMSVNDHPEYMGHELVYRIHAPAHNVTALVGIHNTALGPGLGGIRYKHYADENTALTDVLRLSEAMTWKNAASHLEFGGGKSVLMAPAGSTTPSNIALEVLAAGLNIINEETPRYYGAEDMNINEKSLDYMYEIAPWIKGATSHDPEVVSGTPSPLTAIGLFESMKVAAQYKMGTKSLKGVRVSMQGLGAVGGALARMLHKEGATLIATDMSDTPFEELRAEGIEIEKTGLNEIFDAPADIFAPNAIGGTLTNDTVERLNKAGVQIVCGAANNQQQDQINFTQSKLMHKLGMLYCADYMVNAGGVIWVAKVGENAHQETEAIRTGVPQRFQETLDLYDQDGTTDMATIAAQYSRMRVKAAQDAK